MARPLHETGWNYPVAGAEARAEKRLSAKSAECDELLARLRRRMVGGDAPPARDGAADHGKFRVAKHVFAKRFHPDRVSAGGVERTVREEVFKEYWADLRRIEVA